MPFGASDVRPCNKKTRVFGPGPGTYINIHEPKNSSVCKSLNKIREDRTLAEQQGLKIGGFGTNCDRVDSDW